MDTRVGVETTGTETVARTEAEMAGKTTTATTVNSASVVIHCFVAAISTAARSALGRANRGNGIFWVLRIGAPWRDLPATYGPRTTCYNRFVRWRRAGVWDQIMVALAAGHDAAVQMIDTSVVRVHKHGACIADNNQQDMGRSRGDLTSKIHSVVDTMAAGPSRSHAR